MTGRKIPKRGKKIDISIFKSGGTVYRLGFLIICKDCWDRPVFPSAASAISTADTGLKLLYTAQVGWIPVHTVPYRPIPSYLYPYAPPVDADLNVMVGVMQ